ncbi:4-alpha-glucanotransferase [Microbacterium sp. No. 7]|uniref:4-alpha-glucanotransferase n=1 Tax=Microbacterium sp. No. 7 TaxID=1714373 RepID=UPI0006D2C2C1|nr:4-alpha-glucanotransferase [Microbacterium sp. No. 7]ALJ22294.1 4-alpha-glucanotransferase [Microbacterium sp. No. 7]
MSAASTTHDEQPTPALIALAEAYGVSAEYWSFYGERVRVPASTLRAVLDALGVDAGTPELIDAALADATDAPWRELLPPSLVTRAGERPLTAHVHDGHDVHLSIALEDGQWVDLPVPGQRPETRDLDGIRVWRLEIPLPADLPLGWHTVHAWERRGEEAGRTASATLVIAPDRLPEPPSRPEKHGRGWGLMAQLYSVRSARSWGLGDLADLADLAAVAGERGADFVLVNPVHAAEVTAPIEPSPYLPTTRRFLAPLYVRPEDIREVAYLGPAHRALVARARKAVASANTDAAHLDRDATWTAKRAALEVIHGAPRSRARQAEFDAFVAREGQPLRDFALWCALEEHFEGEDRPDETRDIGSPLVERLREELAETVDFHVWLQWIVDQQAERAQAAALAAGMRIGVMHDLAVGVHPLGSDAWSLAGMYAHGLTVGAPPDMYNQQGQDWSQPPWHPHALAKVGYAPVRDMLRTLLRHAGALRIDHVIGLFRLWCIPAGYGPAAGTFVNYDHRAMLGVLALEALRAGAVIIGEDLGTVEPWVRDELSARGILGTSVLWFEHGDDGPLAPEHYRRDVLATVNTHDLPPTAGYLADEHVALRDRLGLLEQSVDEALADAARERGAMLDLLRRRGLLSADAGEQEVIEALHRLIAQTPSRLVGVALVDAVGERRTQNQPGTYREYPNWQVPLAGPDGAAVLVEDLAGNARFLSLTAAVDGALRG